MLRTSRVVSVALCVLLGLAAASAFAQRKNQELWIISGQSNACGRGKLPGLKPHRNVVVYEAASGKWVPAQDPLPGMGSRGVAPWHAAALGVAEADVKVAMTGHAVGGRPIAAWDEDTGGWRILKARIRAAGRGATAFMWYQGENDGSTSMDAKTYQQKLTALVSRVRKAAGNRRMLAVVIQLGSWRRKNAGDFMPIRKAQRRFVISDGNAVLVPALGRTMRDYVHLDRDGQLELGREIARAILKVRHKKDEGNWPGPVLDDAVLDTQRKGVAAHFAEVEKLAGCVSDDFAVVDATGVVKCVKARAENTRVALTFERAIQLPAELVYGYGQNPKASLVDEAGNRAPAVWLRIGETGVLEDKPTRAPNGAGTKKD